MCDPLTGSTAEKMTTNELIKNPQPARINLPALLLNVNCKVFVDFSDSSGAKGF